MSDSDDKLNIGKYYIRNWLDVPMNRFNKYNNVQLKDWDENNILPDYKFIDVSDNSEEFSKGKILLLKPEYFKWFSKFHKHQSIPIVFFTQIDSIGVNIVSHIWETAAHPDPMTFQFKDCEKYSNKPLFYDFSCLPQWPRTDEEEMVFKLSLANMGQMYQGKMFNNSTIIGQYNSKKAMSRGWPLFEMYSASKNDSIISNLQPEIKLIKEECLQLVVTLESNMINIKMDDFTRIKRFFFAYNYHHIIKLLTDMEELIYDKGLLFTKFKTWFKKYSELQRMFQSEDRINSQGNDNNSSKMDTKYDVISRQYELTWGDSFRDFRRLLKDLKISINESFKHFIINELSFALFTNGSDADKLKKQIIDDIT
jgi:hypothetical protein